MNFITIVLFWLQRHKFSQTYLKALKALLVIDHLRLKSISINRNHFIVLTMEHRMSSRSLLINGVMMWPPHTIGEEFMLPFSNEFVCLGKACLGSLVGSTLSSKMGLGFIPNSIVFRCSMWSVLVLQYKQMQSGELACLSVCLVFDWRIYSWSIVSIDQRESCFAPIVLRWSQTHQDKAVHKTGPTVWQLYRCRNALKEISFWFTEMLWFGTMLLDVSICVSAHFWWSVMECPGLSPALQSGLFHAFSRRNRYAL